MALYLPLFAFFVKITSMIYQEQCEILENKPVAADHYKISFSCKNVSKNAVPGQFVQIRVSDSISPLLRRPFSFHKIHKDSFEILYHVVGYGTKILSERKKGEKLDIIGPLGNGFKMIKGKTAVLIAGGCGSAPLYALEEKLKKMKIESHFFLGATTENLLLCQSDLTKIGTKLYVSTDDGSCGEKCTVGALYSSHLDRIPAKKSVIYACGPKAMLRAVCEIALEKKIPAQISLEEHMACGVGACLGCVVNTTAGYKRVCKDGPVFDSKELLWQ